LNFKLTLERVADKWSVEINGQKFEMNPIELLTLLFMVERAVQGIEKYDEH